MRRLAVSAAIALSGLASAAYAHPKLLSATPAPNTVVAAPGKVELHFSERLMPKFTGADLLMAAHGGRAHAPVKVPASAAVAGDRRTLVVTPKSPLSGGRYSVAWHAVSVDTHRVAGNFAFSVK